MDSKCFPNPWMELCLGGVAPTPRWGPMRKREIYNIQSLFFNFHALFLFNTSILSQK